MPNIFILTAAAMAIMGILWIISGSYWLGAGAFGASLFAVLSGLVAKREMRKKDEQALKANL